MTVRRLGWTLILVGSMAATAYAQGTDRPVRVAGGVVAGQILIRVTPVYPQEAREQQVSGTVVLHAIIAKDGSIANLTAVSGPEMLQASALDAVRQWTYKPYLLNGEPVEVDTTITVNYNMGPSPGPETSLGAPPPPPPPILAAKPIGLNRARISGGVMAGQLLTKVNPVYPGEARYRGVSGAVVLHAIISKDGSVEEVSAISGPELLRGAAMDAVKQWRYRSYLLNGEPVEVDTTVVVMFSFGGPAAQ